MLDIDSQIKPAYIRSLLKSQIAELYSALFTLVTIALKSLSPHAFLIAV